MAHKDTEQEKVIGLIHQRRRLLPREGGRKLYRYLQPYLQEYGIKMGRDRLFALLREHQMLIEPRRKYKMTTQSRHHFYTYQNLIKGYVPDGPNQLWVSDITYLRTQNGFCYLALITDAFSRKIVGYDVSNSLELKGTLKALKSALRSLPDHYNLIHHSDRGFQYCSNAYTKLLSKHNINISMAAKGNCYENALAERVNGILKDEFFLDLYFDNMLQAKKACVQAIKRYNSTRFHLALEYKTPNQVHYNAA
jgi:transposase InsO family protein